MIKMSQPFMLAVRGCGGIGVAKRREDDCPGSVQAESKEFYRWQVFSSATDIWAAMSNLMVKLMERG